MANPWFRLYSEFADDPKVQMMSEAMQRRLTMLMCSRCKGETLRETEMAFHWRISMSELAETKAVFIENGFIDEHWDLLNWNRRQFISDSSTERVRRHRKALKQEETLHSKNVTPATPNVTAPEQNRTEAEQTQMQSEDSCPPATQPDLPVKTPEELAAEAEAAQKEQARLADLARKGFENEQIDRLFDYYLRKLRRDPKKYTLTDKRREKARSRLREREKLSDLTGAVRDAKQCIDNLAASDYHREGGYIDWEAQIFRSAEEFENRLNWVKPTGGNTNVKPERSQQILTSAQRLDEKLRSHAVSQPTLSGGGDDETESAARRLCS